MANATTKNKWENTMHHPSPGSGRVSVPDSDLAKPKSSFPARLRFSTLLLAMAICLGYLALSAALTDDVDRTGPERSASR